MPRNSAALLAFRPTLGSSSVPRTAPTRTAAARAAAPRTRARLRRWSRCPRPRQPALPPRPDPLVVLLVGAVEELRREHNEQHQGQHQQGAQHQRDAELPTAAGVGSDVLKLDTTEFDAPLLPAPPPRWVRLGRTPLVAVPGPIPTADSEQDTCWPVVANATQGPPGGAQAMALRLPGLLPTEAKAAPSDVASTVECVNASLRAKQRPAPAQPPSRGRRTSIGRWPADFVQLAPPSAVVKNAPGHCVTPWPPHWSPPPTAPCVASVKSSPMRSL